MPSAPVSPSDEIGDRAMFRAERSASAAELIPERSPGSNRPLSLRASLARHFRFSSKAERLTRRLDALWPPTTLGAPDSGGAGCHGERPPNDAPGARDRPARPSALIFGAAAFSSPSPSQRCGAGARPSRAEAPPPTTSSTTSSTQGAAPSSTVTDTTTYSPSGASPAGSPPCPARTESPAKGKLATARFVGDWHRLGFDRIHRARSSCCRRHRRDERWCACASAQPARYSPQAKTIRYPVASA